MQLSDYQLSAQNGFLPQQDPLKHLADADTGIPTATIDHVEGVAGVMPNLLENDISGLRKMLEDLPAYDFTDIEDSRVVERLFLIYAYLANAYVFSEPDNPRKRLPSGLAVPFSQIAARVERPPIFSYSSHVLNNYRRLHPERPIDLENTEELMRFGSTPDEIWFGLVHVNVEAAAAPALVGIEMAVNGAENGDSEAVHAGLTHIAEGIHAATTALRRMGEGCHPDVFYRLVRPYLMGFVDLIYDGVDAEPQTLTGGSGAQSSLIPAVVAALGVQHESSGLTSHLSVMQQHMPIAHRQFIADMTTDGPRNVASADEALHDVYNLCLHQVMLFRKLHLNLAKAYVFEKLGDTLGTGGTRFMSWLAQLVDETESNLI